MKYRYLSHMISAKVPSYGSACEVVCEATSSIAEGRSSNSFRIAMSNHAGTHIDAPNHFFDAGRKISDFDAGYWVFSRPVVIDVKLAAKEQLKAGDWMTNIRSDNDIVLLRSGWSRFRSETKYLTENPGIDPDTSLAIRKLFPGVRAVGIDWVSVSSFSDRAAGRRTHSILLDPGADGAPKCIIEDMDLGGDMSRLRQVIALPIMIKAIDSAPCTVLGVFDD